MLDIASNLLFFDIETVSQFPSFEDLDAQGKMLWSKKSSKLFHHDANDDPQLSYANRAGIYAEFAKVVCISVGYIHRVSDTLYELRLKSFVDHDEVKVLQDFADLLASHYYNIAEHGLCGHNIREFDVPFLSRRMLVHGIKLPSLLDIRYAKPWEREHLIDTLQDWKFGDYKNYTSLDSLCYTFGIKSPKDAMSGADVHAAYYEDEDLTKIGVYCEEDVKATMQVYLRLQNISTEDIELIPISRTRTDA